MIFNISFYLLSKSYFRSQMNNDCIINQFTVFNTSFYDSFYLKNFYANTYTKIMVNLLTFHLLFFD